MRKIIIIIAVITLGVFGLLLYQYHEQKYEVAQFDVYQNVLNEKSAEIYEQATDWSKPISIQTEDDRLDTDFQIMADFMLKMMVRNAELRNAYLRELKAEKWDKFLDISRLEQDKKYDFIETETMLKQVGTMVELYQNNLDQHKIELKQQIKDLPIKARFRRYLIEALIKNDKADPDHALFELEKKSYSKAQQIFKILKEEEWQNKNNTFLFESEKTVDNFNQLYAKMLDLDKQMKALSKSTQKKLEQVL
ncbi:hypothetical protein [Acinetobacter equi]|uniref:Uncharacterized protein n=1 Tax=Acinetobacter equi TaxID=1324350 RepID=A0A0N9VBT7_9GAMM|nr:hypothetical protein [Acinetobacter equi]ALH94540.1 hypothetical protein AOY20_02720 [Acinetobacter equi]